MFFKLGHLSFGELYAIEARNSIYKLFTIIYAVTLDEIIRINEAHNRFKVAKVICLQIQPLELL